MTSSFSPSYYAASRLAAQIKGESEYRKEMFNGTVSFVNEDSSYNVLIRANDTTIYGIPNRTGKKFQIGDSVTVVRKEGSRELMEITGYSGYAVPLATTVVDIAL